MNVDSDKNLLFCRLEDKASRSAHRGISNGAINADVLELNQKSSYSTFQHSESEVLYRGRKDFAYKWKKPTYYREAEVVDEVDQEVFSGVLNAGHTVQDWGRAAEECRKKKKLFAHGYNTSAELKTIQDEDSLETDKYRRKTIV